MRTHVEPSAASLHVGFAAASLGLYLLTFFILVYQRNVVLWLACLAISLVAVARSIGASAGRGATAAALGEGLIVASGIGAATGAPLWAFGFLAAFGGAFLALWAEYPCPENREYLFAVCGHRAHLHPLHRWTRSWPRSAPA